MIHTDLRPLGIGEIFDRAVTLFVRRFAVLILILALVAIPIAIVNYIVAPQTAGLVDDLRRVLAVPPGHPQEQRAIFNDLAAHNKMGQWGAVLIFASTILGALSTTACVIAIAQSYAGRVPSVREVYSEALRRWFSQLVAIVVYVALGFAIFMVLVIAIVFVGLAFGALATVSTPVALIVGIPVAIIIFLVLLAIGALIYLCAEMSLISIALEDPNPIRGIAQGLRRTLSPPIFWRSLLVATIAFVVTLLGGVMVAAIAGTISVVTHLSPLYPVIAVVGGVVLNALVMSFIVVYSFDIRVRREGYDLVLLAQEPAP